MDACFRPTLTPASPNNETSANAGRARKGAGPGRFYFDFPQSEIMLPAGCGCGETTLFSLASGCFNRDFYPTGLRPWKGSAMNEVIVVLVLVLLLLRETR